MKRELESLNIGYAVPVSNVNKELSNIWQNEAENEGDAVTRASTLNLVIITSDWQQFTSTSHMTPEITVHHPGRIILVYVDKNSDSEKIESFVSVNCQLPESGSKQICFEQITLKTGSQGEQHLSGVILPLLLPELPVFLWWQNETKFQEKVYSGLYEAVDHVILSLPLQENSFVSFQKTLLNLSSLQNELRLSDLQWARLTAWREAIAQFFDRRDGGQLLDSLSHLYMESDGDNLSLPAFLITGWLASRLGWEPKDVEKSDLSTFSFMKQNKTPVSVQIHNLKDKKNNNGLRKVKIVSSSQQDDIEFYCELNLQGFIESRMLRNKKVEQKSIIQYSKSTDAQLICNELDFVLNDVVFAETIDKLKKIIKLAL